MVKILQKAFAEANMHEWVVYMWYKGFQNCHESDEDGYSDKHHDTLFH